MGRGVLLKVRGHCVVALCLILTLWRSCMVCKARGYGAPNLTHYEGHFSPIIPDLTLFLEEQCKKQDEKGIRGTRGNRVPKRVASRPKLRFGHNKAREGLYVLDLLSHWANVVHVWSNQVDEIDVLLQPDQAWTQELNEYRNKGVILRASLPYKTLEKSFKLQIYEEPFAGLSRPHGKPKLKALLEKLPCRFFRLSRWVFDRELGALAMIYVQVAKRNKNMLARLALFHAPTSTFVPQTLKQLYKPHFNLWIYQNPSDLEPMPANKINVQKLVRAIKSLALNNTYGSNQTFSKGVSSNGQLPSPKQEHPYMLPSNEDHNPYNHLFVERDDIKYEAAHVNGSKSSELEAAMILASLKYHHHLQDNPILSHVGRYRSG